KHENKMKGVIYFQAIEEVYYDHLKNAHKVFMFYEKLKGHGRSDEAMLCSNDAGRSCVTHVVLTLMHFSVFHQQRSSVQSDCTRMT
ncbi:hypothetical protein GOODEAATRI_007248, partial [Goodea atripinnis]